MGARVRTHLLFDMERNADPQHHSPNKRMASYSSNQSYFSLCGLNLRNDRTTKPREHNSNERSTGIAGGFQSFDYDYKTNAAYRQNMSRSILRSESDRSDEVQLMDIDLQQVKKKRFSLWEEDDDSSDVTSPEVKPVVRGRMYSKIREPDDQLTSQTSSDDAMIGTSFEPLNRNANRGAVPKSRQATEVASKSSALPGSDYLIIPRHLCERFLAVGNMNLKQSHGPALSMMEIADPKLCIVLDMIEPRDIPQSQSLSPGSMKPLQRRALMEQLKSLKDVMAAIRETTSASDGMLLMNLESKTLYPFLTYLVVDTQRTDSRNFSSQLDTILSNNIPQDEIHCLAGYEEVATIAKPPLDLATLRKPSSNHTGYIVSMFKVFPGEDSEKLERSWLMWTGARTIYKLIPKQLGLRRITFHKKRHSQAGGLVYVLLCECSLLQQQVTVACGFVSNLRARCCGYTAIYRPIDVL